MFNHTFGKADTGSDVSKVQLEPTLNLSHTKPRFGVSWKCVGHSVSNCSKHWKTASGKQLNWNICKCVIVAWCLYVKDPGSQTAEAMEKRKALNNRLKLLRQQQETQCTALNTLCLNYHCYNVCYLSIKGQVVGWSGTLMAPPLPNPTAAKSHWEQRFGFSVLGFRQNETVQHGSKEEHNDSSFHMVIPSYKVPCSHMKCIAVHTCCMLIEMCLDAN